MTDRQQKWEGVANGLRAALANLRAALDVWPEDGLPSFHQFVKFLVLPVLEYVAQGAEFLVKNLEIEEDALDDDTRKNLDLGRN